MLFLQSFSYFYYHQQIKIKSATDGEVVLASDEGDYGKHLKIQIGEVSIIYAHCNALRCV